MAYQAGTIDVALAAALGDDTRLIADLRLAFGEGASRHFAALGQAETEAEVWDAVTRLRSLAASFGLQRLVVALAPVVADRRVTAAQLRRIARILASMKAC